MLTEDNLVKEDLDNRSDTYDELADSLFKYTDGFTTEGAYPAQDKSEVENVYNILSKYYYSVRKSTDTRRASAESGADYKVYFRDPKPEVNESLKEAIEKHDELNKDLFDGNHLKSEVREKILDVVDIFMDKLKEDGIELEPLDVLVLGSNASYNYTKDSDIDVHIVADTSIYEDKDDLAIKLYNAYRQIFNSKYDPVLYGHELELYVEPDECKANSNGIYSVMNDDWVKVPKKSNIPEPDMEEVERLLKPFEDRYEEAETIEDIDSLINDIYIERQKGILNSGEYDPRNLCFKEFRNRGMLSDLKQRKIDLETKNMSLGEKIHMKYSADLHEALDMLNSVNEDYNSPLVEVDDEFKASLHKLLDDWYESKKLNSQAPHIRSTVMDYAHNGGDPMDAIDIADDDMNLQGIITDYSMGDYDKARSVADYSLKYLGNKMNDQLTEATENWRMTPYGFKELDYRGFVITDTEGGPAWMGSGFTVDMGGDELLFDSLEEAKAFIDDEVDSNPDWYGESLDECGDKFTSPQNPDIINTDNGIQDESLNESNDLQDIPLVDRVNFSNVTNNRMPGLVNVKALVAELERIASEVGPKFKIRSTKFGNNVSYSDIRDEWMTLKKLGWSIYRDNDPSIKGFNEVYVCSRLANESLDECGTQRSDMGSFNVTNLDDKYEMPEWRM